MTVACGSRATRAEVSDLREPAVTRCAFAALARFVDDPERSLDELDRFLTVEVVATGQIWVFDVETFLQNLALRSGDQSRTRQMLATIRRPARG